MENTLKVLYNRMGIVADLKHSAALLNWDQQTYMPPKSITGRALQLSTLQKTAHEILISKKTEELLSGILPYKKQLSEEDIDYLTVLEENYKREKKIPVEIVEQLTIETSEGIAAWDIARKENSFKKFLPGLKKIINLSRKIADYITFDEHPYDALLDQYEPGIKSNDLMPVFDQLAKKLTPMLARYKNLGKFENLMDGINFSSKKQTEFLKKLIKELGFNFNAGRFDESAHPFTTSFTCNDVRLTTRIDEKDFRSAFYGAVHECGHGLYELGFGNSVKGNLLASGTSLGIHESQSRTWENVIGRSYSFWKYY
ncbi:MAG: carboxypeptidase M32, partial [Calditrichia bacterium]|nr:carboxypeptidase M32 [Calditrichia bacterium]